LHAPAAQPPTPTAQPAPSAAAAPEPVAPTIPPRCVDVAREALVAMQLYRRLARWPSRLREHHCHPGRQARHLPRDQWVVGVAQRRPGHALRPPGCHAWRPWRLRPWLVGRADFPTACPHGHPPPADFHPRRRLGRWRWTGLCRRQPRVATRVFVHGQREHRCVRLDGPRSQQRNPCPSGRHSRTLHGERDDTSDVVRHPRGVVDGRCLLGHE